MFFISCMSADQNSRNMLVFSLSGITVLDSNLYQIHDYFSDEVLTSGHGDIIGVGNNYFSHGTRDSSFDVPLRKLVVHKYDPEFKIIKADTLGWPGQDNYPFSNKSI